MDMTAEEGLHLLALLLIAAGIVVVACLVCRCAWCAWHDRRQAHRGG